MTGRFWIPELHQGQTPVEAVIRLLPRLEPRHLGFVNAQVFRNFEIPSILVGSFRTPEVATAPEDKQDEKGCGEGAEVTHAPMYIPRSTGEKPFP
jgi:hypothetical protein